MPKNKRAKVKSHKLVSIDVIDAVVGMKMSLQAEDPYINMVLVVSGNLTARARQRAERMGIEVWDGLKLASMTPQDVIDILVAQSKVLTLPCIGIPKQILS